MEILNFSRQFTGGGVINTAKSFLPVVCGLPDSIITAINEKYTVHIITKGEYPSRIRAWLQDKFSFNVSSDWTDVARMDGGPLQDASMIATGKTFVSTMGTRRKWKGTSPIAMNIKLKFEAFNDVWKEVIEPCMNLQSLVCPGGPLFSFRDEDFFLSPPGPNPFYFPSMPGSQGNTQNSTPRAAIFNEGQVTSMEIGGGFINFDKVIIKSVDVTYESRMSKDGPVGAEAVVVFETYEMLTKKKLITSYGTRQAEIVEVGGRQVAGIPTPAGLAV